MARLDELERKFEENPRRYFAPLANEYRKAGDAAKAAELCRSQLPDVPGHISGHIVLGQALFDSGDFPGSRTALETALGLDPENIVALRYLGDIARNTGDTAEAERWYSRTLEADPYNEAASQGLQALREQDSAIVTTDTLAEFTSPEAPVPATEAEAYPTLPDVPQAESVEAGESPPVARELDDRAEVATETAAPAEGFEPTAHAFESVPDQAMIEPTGDEPLASAADDSAAASTDAASMASEEIAPTASDDFVSFPVPIGIEERSSEPAAADVQEPAVETVAEHEPAIAEPELTVTEPAPALADDVQVEDAPASAEFAGDLAISAASESTEEGTDETQAESAESLSVEAIPADAEVPQVVADEMAPPEAVPGDEAMQAEERVMESAAPFVTETMADLYLEQGYPHEALELLLQLAEQRPEDERLHEKVAYIESVIAARRDAAVAAARAERAEMAHAADAGARAGASEDLESATVDVPEAAVAEPELPDAPLAFEIPPFQRAEEEAPTTVRDMFARMDRARPRPPSAVTPRPLSRLRSDFVPMPDSGGAEGESADDPFAFPDAPRPEQRVARTSGPHPTFNPSTADIDDFEAWLRGLKGP